MKNRKILLALLVLACLMVSAAAAALADEGAVFADPVFEAKVRALLNRPEGEITRADCLGIAELHFANMDMPPEERAALPDGQRIHDLSDLQYFPNLVFLDIGNNAVKDLSPVAQLAQLTTLEAPLNKICDINPITSLTKLECVTLWENQITDIGPVANLKALKMFSVFSNRVADISPLAQLDRLLLLIVRDNPISDYSSVASLYPDLERMGFYDEDNITNERSIYDERVKAEGAKETEEAQAAEEANVKEEPEEAKAESKEDLFPFQYAVASGVGGETNAVAAAGQTVYVGKGTSVVVLQNNGGALVRTGTGVTLDSFVTCLAVRDGVLYAAAGPAGVYLIDIADPQASAVVGRYTSAGYAEAVAVRDQLLYIANGDMGLEIADVSDPLAPAFISRVYQGYYAFDVALADTYACIAAADDGLLVADITDPEAPAPLSAYDTPGVARSVILTETLALVADDWQGVCVIDLRDIQNPVFAAKLDTAGRAYDLALKGNTLYIADAYMGLRVLNIKNLSSPVDAASYVPIDSQTVGVFLDGDTLYCADQNNGLTCFHVGDAKSLSLTGMYAHALPLPLELPGELRYLPEGKRIARLGTLGMLGDEAVRPYDQITRAEFAAMLCWAAGLNDTPAEGKAAFSDVPAGHPYFAAIAHVAELGIMDAAKGKRFKPDDPMTYTDIAACLLKLVHRFPEAGTGPDNISEAAEALGFGEVYSQEDARAGVGRGDAMAMLEKVVSEIPDGLTNQTLLKGMGVNLEAAQSVAYECEIWDGYMALPAGSSGICFFDIRDPAHIRQIAQLNENDSIKFIKVHGDYAYAFSEDWIFTVNIANPVSPYTVSSTRFISGAGGPPRNVVIEGERIYIADEWGIKIYSIEEPSKPELINQTHLMSDTLAIGASTSDIAVRDGIAYLAFEQRGIEIYDLRDVENIRMIGSYTGDDLWIPNVQFFGDYAIIKTQNGSEILDIRDIENPVKAGTIKNQSSTQFNYCAGIYGQFALLPDDTNGVMVVDLSDIKNPVRLGRIDTPGIPIGVKVDRGTAYIMDGVGGVMILDLAPEGESAAASDAPPADVLSSGSPYTGYQAAWFRGPSVEESALSGDKAVAAIRRERERTDYTETLIVSTTASSGKGSLPWCVENVPEGGRILFDTDVFPPSNPAVIYLTEAVSLNRAGHVTIDASGAGVIIDGGNNSRDYSCIGIYTQGNVIRGLQIQNFPNISINVAGAGNIIGGSRDIGEGPNGEGNVLIRCGVMIMNGPGVTDNIIAGNNIGVGADGVTPAGNSDGIQLRQYASRNVIGIDRAGYGNIVSNNGANGISCMESPYNNLIEGNYVGTDRTGTLTQGNGRHGICIEMSGFGNVIRNNVTADNGRYGVLIDGVMGSYNVVIGNRIGVGADAATALHNHENDVLLSGGFGGTVTGIVFGGKGEELKNIIATWQGRTTFVIGRLVYGTMIDGEVYHYLLQSDGEDYQYFQLDR